MAKEGFNLGQGVPNEEGVVFFRSFRVSVDSFFGFLWQFSRNHGLSTWTGHYRGPLLSL